MLIVNRALNQIPDNFNLIEALTMMYMIFECKQPVQNLLFLPLAMYTREASICQTRHHERLPSLILEGKVTTYVWNTISRSIDLF